MSRIDLPDESAPSNVITIPLTRGYVAIIDEADAHLALFRWKAHGKPPRVVYAMRAVTVRGVRREFLLHREVLGVPPGVYVDHINGDGLDCRRRNLRVATSRENARNQRRRRNTSGFKGVIRRAVDVNWSADIVVDGTSLHLGMFGDPETAARAYDEAARRYFGEFACVNFPRPGERAA